MPKLVLIAFILLLVYLIIDSFYSKTKVESSGVHVFGFYSGFVDKNSKKELVVNLSDNQLSTDSNKSEAKIPEKQSVSNDKNNKLETIKLGNDFTTVVSLLGQPSKNLSVKDGNKDSGFELFVWEKDRKILILFFKKKVIKVL
jgi:phosphatidate phosphatase PAH1